MSRYSNLEWLNSNEAKNIDDEWVSAK